MSGKNRPYLLGSHVWCSFMIGKKPELYDFQGATSGIFLFKNRSTGIVIGKTIHQLTNYPGFRPFCINPAYLNPDQIITNEPVVVTKGEPNGAA